MKKKLSKVLKRLLIVGLPLILAAFIISGSASSSKGEIRLSQMVKSRCQLMYRDLGPMDMAAIHQMKELIG